MIRSIQSSFRFLCLASFLANIGGCADVQYKDVVLSQNIIWGLRETGYLKLFDLATGNELERDVHAGHGIILIAKDRDDHVIIANTAGTIKKYDEKSNSWEDIANYDVEPVGLLFDNKNLCFSITEKGIQDLSSKKMYFNHGSINHQIQYQEGWGKPYCFFIDRNDIIWLGFGYGEWGGNLLAFQTQTRAFLDLSLNDFRMELFPIKSILEDSSAVYISAGVQHFYTSGTIVRFDSLKAVTVFKSESGWSTPAGQDTTRTWVSGEYIGPAAYNVFNNSIYYYSQTGIHRGDKSKDLSEPENWKIVVSPKLAWKDGQRDAVGSPMNLLKLCLIDSTRLVFLSQNDGIGYYNGKEILMLK